MKKYIFAVSVVITVILSSCKKNCYKCSVICVVDRNDSIIICSTDYPSYNDFFAATDGYRKMDTNITEVCDDEAEVERYRSMSYYCEKKK